MQRKCLSTREQKSKARTEARVSNARGAASEWDKGRYGGAWKAKEEGDGGGHKVKTQLWRLRCKMYRRCVRERKDRRAHARWARGDGELRGTP